MRNDSAFIAILNTKGRKTGKVHSKMLKAVAHNDKIYFSRHRPDSDWYKNIIVNSNVQVEIEGKRVEGTASIVKDEKLLRKISELKYPGEKRAEEKRVVIEITLCE